MNATEIAGLVGAKKRANGVFVGKCPAHNDRKPSLSIEDAGDRVLLHCHAGCYPEAVVASVGLSLSDLFHEGSYREYSKKNSSNGLSYGQSLFPEDLDLQRPRTLIDSRVGNGIPSFEKKIDGRNSRERQIRRLVQVWHQAKPIQGGDLADKYLKSRSICLEHYPEAMRFHPSLPYRHEDGEFSYHPALVSRIDCIDGLTITLHRTYLNREGGKARVGSPKKIMSLIPPDTTIGAAIQLFPASHTLAIAEGIETALAFYCLTNVHSWATVTAGGMESVVLPANVEDVIIAADLDRSGRGEEAARVLRRRLRNEGREVHIFLPSMNDLCSIAKTRGELPKSCDWADVLDEVKK